MGMSLVTTQKLNIAQNLLQAHLSKTCKQKPAKKIHDFMESNKKHPALHLPTIRCHHHEKSSHAGKRKRSAAPWTRPAAQWDERHIDLRFLVNFCW